MTRTKSRQKVLNTTGAASLLVRNPVESLVLVGVRRADRNWETPTDFSPKGWESLAQGVGCAAWRRDMGNRWCRDMGGAFGHD
jgi:hypothetical protein